MDSVIARLDWIFLLHSAYYVLFVRKRLFNMINDHPSVYEAMVDRKQRENKPGVDNSGKSRHSTKVACCLFSLCQNIMQLSALEISDWHFTLFCSDQMMER
jgi:hypothetical protein